MSTDSATSPAAGEDLPADEVANEGEIEDFTDGQQTEGDDDDQPIEDDEPEDFEFEGKKIAVPKSVAGLLKEGLLRQADYTRKTQDLAAERTTLADAQKAHAEQVERATALLDKRAELKVIDKDLDVYKKMTPQDWGKLREDDRDQFDQHRLNFEFLKEQRVALDDEVKAGETKAIEGQRAASAKAVEQGLAVLQKDIKDFTPAYFNNLVSFGAQFGLKEAEVRGSLGDPRLIKVLNEAYVAKEALAKAVKTGRVTQAQSVKPAVRVGGAAPANKGDLNRIGSTDAWMAARRSQIAAKQKGGR